MITNILTYVNSHFFNDEEGVSAVEYAILAALIVVGLVASVPKLAAGVDAAFVSIVAQIPGASAGG